VHLTSRCHSLPKQVSDDYTLSGEVLAASNGKVQLATSNLNPKETFVVKEFDLKHMSASAQYHLKGELSVFLCMDHPHVARLVDVYECPEQLNLVMEHISGGELFDRAHHVKSFSDFDAADAIRQILSAVNYIHSHGMVHRDLKLENILYDSKDGQHLKLIDFGFSKFCNPLSRMHTSCGTVHFVAPEVVDSSFPMYTSKCDVWSVGVITYVLLSGDTPFTARNDGELRKNIIAGKVAVSGKAWKNVSSAAKDFVKSLLQVDPQKRLSTEAALRHKWIQANYNETIGAMPFGKSSHIFDALCSWRTAPKIQRTCLSVMAWSLSNEQQSKVRDYFLALDQDLDGVITLEEFRNAIVNVCKEDDDTMIDQFEAVDSNHDGQITYSDFLASMIGVNVDLTHELLQTAFRKFDAKKEGCITGESFRDIMGHEYDGECAESIMSTSLDGKISYTEFADYIMTAKLSRGR